MADKNSNWENIPKLKVTDYDREFIMNYAKIAMRDLYVDPARTTNTGPNRNAVEKFLRPVSQKTSFSDIIGNQAARELLLFATKEAKEQSTVAKAYAIQPPKGVLLYGPPGCGKTLLAAAAAKEMGNEEYISIAASDLYDKYFGETEKHIKAIFTYAREYYNHYGKKLIVFIDECEMILGSRSNGFRQSISTPEFLHELDGHEELGAFVILATNRPEEIDEAIIRDGRISRKIKVERPTREDVGAIIQLNLNKLPVAILAEPSASLIFAAVETLFDDALVLETGKLIKARMVKQKPGFKISDVNFCLSDIMNGAMAAGVVERAKQFAYQRDRASGVVTGITTDDMIRAGREIYEDNRNLPHMDAMTEFAEKIMEG